MLMTKGKQWYDLAIIISLLIGILVDESSGNNWAPLSPERPGINPKSN